MEMLERGAINGTGVPSVIMNYINEADYAKTLVMGNAKFMGRVINHQMNFNDSITSMYKKLLRMETAIPDDVIESFKFKFLPPETLNNINMADIINNKEQVISYMMEALTGKNSDPGEEGNMLKDELYKIAAQELLPMLPWDRMKELMKDAKNKVKERIAEKKLDKEPDDGM